MGGDGENGVNYENIGEWDGCRSCQAKEWPLFKVALSIARKKLLLSHVLIPSVQ